MRPTALEAVLSASVFTAVMIFWISEPCVGFSCINFVNARPPDNPPLAALLKRIHLDAD
jgi:hypothetical protein